MNDLDTSLIYLAETASDRFGPVHWSHSNTISLFSDIHIVVVVSQSWKNPEHFFFVDESALVVIFEFCKFLKPSGTRYDDFENSIVLQK